MLKEAHNVDEKNFDCFKNVMTNVRVNEAEKIIKQTDAPVYAIKSLVLDFASETKKSSSMEQKNAFADMIEGWNINLNQCRWHSDLIEFCENHENIMEAYFVKNSGNEEFIVVMDDSTDDSVLDYNEFAFALRHKYAEIYDFMILDPTMMNGIGSMFEKMEKIYERGNCGADCK